MSITRREERMDAFFMLFEMTFGDESLEEHLENARESRDAKLTPFSLQLVTGVTENVCAIDERLEAHLENWHLNRVSRTELTAMRMAAYEILFCEDIPNSVAINEAVECAKTFAGEEAGAFVNGVLGGLFREIERQRDAAEAAKTE